MICALVHEESEDKICHFYGGLRREIQDIVDYKEYTTVNHLFQLAIVPACYVSREGIAGPPTEIEEFFHAQDAIDDSI